VGHVHPLLPKAICMARRLASLWVIAIAPSAQLTLDESR
jgi:hypothetical protein